MSRLDKLSKDALFSIAILLDLPDLLNFCNSSSKINKIICRSDQFWINKIQRDFSILPKIGNAEYKQQYKYLYGLFSIINDIIRKNKELQKSDDVKRLAKLILEDFKKLSRYYDLSVGYRILHDDIYYYDSPPIVIKYVVRHLIDNTDKSLKNVYSIREFLSDNKLIQA